MLRKLDVLVRTGKLVRNSVLVIHNQKYARFDKCQGFYINIDLLGRMSILKIALSLNEMTFDGSKMVNLENSRLHQNNEKSSISEEIKLIHG